MKREKYHHGKGPGRATDGVTSVNRIFREELLLEQKLKELWADTKRSWELCSGKREQDVQRP